MSYRAAKTGGKPKGKNSSSQGKRNKPMTKELVTKCVANKKTVRYLYSSCYLLYTRYFRSGSNAITPRPNWPITSKYGNIMTSTKAPESETDYNAMDFNLWKNLGHEFMVKSNINHWIACR